MKENRPLLYCNTPYLIELLETKTTNKATPQIVKEYIKRGKIPQPASQIKGTNVFILTDVETAITSNFEPIQAT